MSAPRTHLPETSRRMVSCGADKGHAQSRTKPGRLWARSQAPTRTAAPQLPAQPRAVRPTSTATTSRLLWPSYGTSSYSTTRATTRRKAAQNEAKAEKTSAAIYFYYPGQLDFGQ